jgi:carboxypeptidase C (cathepsin A)
MIDPVATGFSHTENGASNNPFFGVLNDYTSVATFIQTYLNANNRWTSPKYILGESYGGVRGSLLAHHLQMDYDMAINGLILISPELSDQALSFANIDNNTPYWANFPSMAATAWYHHTIAAKYQSLTVDELFSLAQKFANTVLRGALDAGNALNQTQFDQVAQQMAELTGLSAQEIKQNNLKISTYYFFLHALASQNQVIGRYDSRFTAVNIPGPHVSYLDPSDSATSRVFGAGINQYLRVDLNWQSASPYNVFGAITEWPEGSRTEVVTDLGQALSENPNMKLFVANGYFDFACSMGADDYELSQIPGGRSFADRITHNRYFGGHMMYINPDALHQLKADIALFMTGSQALRTKTSLD